MDTSAASDAPIRQVHFVTRFTCDGDRCIDSCCKRYEIVKMEPPIVERLQADAPHLLDHAREGDDGWVMRVDDQRVCSACINNLCQIQVELGPSALPEICFSFPRRLTRLFGQVFVTANLPCNLVVESALYGEDPFSWDVVPARRLPPTLGNTREADFAGFTPDELFAMHEQVMRFAANPAYGSEELLCRLLALSSLLDGLRRTDWGFMIGLLLEGVAREGTISHLQQSPGWAGPQKEVVSDLLYAVLTTIKHKDHPGLSALLADASELVDRHPPAEIRAMWTDAVATTPLDGLLKRYVLARLAENLFPIANWGDCVDDIGFITLCYSALRLGLLARREALDDFRDADGIVRAVAIVETWYYGRRKEIYAQMTRLGWTSTEALQCMLART